MGSSLLRMEDVASRLGISYHQARALIIVEGKIPHMKVGARGIRVDATHLEEYIKSREQEVKSVTGTSE